MANMKEILPKGEYKVKTVGPNREWEFNGNKMVTDSIQFEGHEQYWIDVNRKADSAAPNPGDTLKGHVEQDDAGKYPPKFKKEQSGSWAGGGGGGKASPGAIWAQNVETATAIVHSFYSLTGKQPKSFDEYLTKIKAVAPKVGSMVDEFVGKNTPAAETKPDTNNEAGESPAPAAAPADKKADVVIEDLDDTELGDW
jgi:hypothetical protein